MDVKFPVTIESMAHAWDELNAYIETLDLLFSKLHADQVHASDEYTTKLRNHFTYFGVDLDNPEVAAAVLFTIYLLSEQAEKIKFTHFTNDPRLNKFIDTWSTNVGLLARELLKDIQAKKNQ